LKRVYKIDKSDFQKVKEVLLKDDIVGRASVKFKDGKTLELEDKYYCYVSGTEDVCEKSDDLMKDLSILYTLFK
jgi:hypothetical protein